MTTGTASQITDCRLQIKGMRYMKQVILILLIIMCACQAFAADPGSAAVPFLRISPGARPAGLGESFVAVANDANATYWNPSGLANLEGSHFSFMHMLVWEDMIYDYLTMASSIDENSCFGVNIIMLNSGAIAVTGEDESGFYRADSDAGSYSYNSMAVALSYGMKIDESFSYGISAKIINDRIADESAQTLALDLGMKYLLGEYISAGLCLQNAGPAIKNETLPLTARAGLAYLNESATVAFEGDYYLDSGIVKLGIGAEYYIGDTFAPRIGYKFQLPSTDNALSGLTLGAGFRMEGYQIDYAYCPSPVLGVSHRISVTIKLK